jgi:hypothetical protein
VHTAIVVSTQLLRDVGKKTGVDVIGYEGCKRGKAFGKGEQNFE